jgi:hypothetical protein
VTVLLIVGTVVSRWRAARQVSARPASPAFAHPLRVLVAVTRGSLMVLLAGATLLLWRWPPRPADAVFIDRTTSPAFAHVAKGRGMLASGGDMKLIQLRTRRPVLVDGGGLDGLPYALESGPALERILRDVYAIDLFNPPEEARGLGMIPNEINRSAWEQFSRERWRLIRRTYHVTQVITPPGWALALPITAHDPGFVVYDIPD